MSVLLTAAGQKNRNKIRWGNSKSARKARKQRPSGATGASAPSTSYQPSTTTRVWNLNVNDTPVSLALCKDNMDLWCNDELLETTDNFSDEGAEIDFAIFDRKGRITISSSGNSKAGMSHTFTLDGQIIPEFKG